LKRLIALNEKYLEICMEADETSEEDLPKYFAATRVSVRRNARDDLFVTASKNYAYSATIIYLFGFLLSRVQAANSSSAITVLPSRFSRA
jgi:hypothetical protein